MAIQFKFVANSDARVVKYMQTRGAAIRKAVYKRMVGLTILIQRVIKQGKLSGQVLKNRTGNLRRSINQRATQQGDLITGIVGVDVTAPYGKAQEYGFQGRVLVKEYLRRTKVNGAFSVVRQHEREMNLPARPFMVPTLKEFTGKIMDELRRGVTDGLKEA